MQIRRFANRRKSRIIVQNWLQDWVLLAIAPSTGVLVLILSWMGLLQLPEWAILDCFFRWRPPEPPDPRIVLVTIGDEDITSTGAWPIPDRILAKALTHLNAQSPRVIGLDLYRDLPVEPGQQELLKVFQSMPNLMGVQMGVGARKVPPPPVLAQLNRVADANIPEDRDKRVRRAMLAGKDQGQVHQGLGLAIALKYLEKETIKPIKVSGAPDTYQLGRARFHPLHRDDGGYVRADDRGYQILLNFRGPASSFDSISFTNVLHNRIPAGFLKDRIVLLGSTAESVKDIFLTPYSDDRQDLTDWTAGVVIHANITSQILSASLDGRPLLRGFPGSLKWLWILAGAGTGVLVSWNLLQANWINKHFSYGGAILGTVLISMGMVTIGYLSFLNGWWVPIATTIFALNGSAIVCFAYHSYKLQRIAYTDQLTQVANRRYFDLYLAQQIYRKGNLSLILCDVDCFKLYNDTYGHLEGDHCLQQVAQTIRRATRSTDLTARYGGEEFAVILPATGVGEAALVAERIVNQIRSLQLPHQSSTVAPYVTLSCGVASAIIDDHQLKSSGWSGTHLINEADQALYRSKQKGRDRFTVSTLDSTRDH